MLATFCIIRTGLPELNTIIQRPKFQPKLQTRTLTILFIFAIAIANMAACLEIDSAASFARGSRRGRGRLSRRRRIRRGRWASGRRWSWRIGATASFFNQTSSLVGSVYLRTLQTITTFIPIVCTVTPFSQTSRPTDDWRLGRYQRNSGACSCRRDCGIGRNRWT